MVVSNAKELEVIIIGAGSTGLLVAQGLKKYGITSTVYERETEYTYKDRPRTWSMALHWGAKYIHKILPPDIATDFPIVETHPTIDLTPEQEHVFQMVNGKTGEVVLNVRGESTRRVSRAKLRRLFSRGLIVQYGKRLRGVDNSGEKVTVHFEDGSSAQGDLLIGCDGAKSAVRAALVSPEENRLEPLPIRHSHISASYTREQALFIKSMYHPLIKIGPHPEQPTFALISVADVPDPAKPETWIFGLIFAEWGFYEQLPTSRERLERAKSFMKNYCEPFRSAALWLPDDTFVPPDGLTVWTNPVKWNNHGGRITLAGDAAHPMSPFRGQGLNNALQDAALYVETIENVVNGRKSLVDAVNEYDADVLERGSKEIKISNIQAYASHHWDVLMDSPMFKAGIGKVEDRLEGKL